MRGYVEQLQKLEGVSAGGGEPELSLLNVVGLFDRPLEGNALTALLTANIPNLTDGLVLHREKVRNYLGWVKEVRERPLSADERSQRFRFAKERLRALKILAPASPADATQIDAHPVVRQYFGDRLKQNYPAAFTAGHARLFQHYASAAPEEPDTLQDMQPLFDAIRHGCLAGEIQPTFHQLYWSRVSRKGDDYAVRTLGAVGPMITILANFFDQPWKQPSARLETGSRRILINRTANLLTASGRLREALEVLDGARITEKYHRNSHYCSLLLDLGRIDEGIEAAEENQAQAKQQDAVRPQVNAFTQLAYAHFLRGNLDRAHQLFTAAEQLQREKIKQTRRQFLFSTNGFLFNQLLLDQGKAAEVVERAENSLVIARRGGNHLAIGLDELVLAQCKAAVGAGKDSLFDTAVAELRLANRDDYLPYGLLWRAAFHRSQRRWDAAGEDLAEIEEIADFGEMQLFLAEAALERARIALAHGNATALPVHSAKAAAIIQQMRYGRRSQEIKELERHLPSRASPAQLSTAAPA